MNAKHKFLLAALGPLLACLSAAVLLFNSGVRTEAANWQRPGECADSPASTALQPPRLIPYSIPSVWNGLEGSPATSQPAAGSGSARNSTANPCLVTRPPALAESRASASHAGISRPAVKSDQRQGTTPQTSPAKNARTAKAKENTWLRRGQQDWEELLTAGWQLAATAGAPFQHAPALHTVKGSGLIKSDALDSQNVSSSLADVDLRRPVRLNLASLGLAPATVPAKSTIIPRPDDRSVSAAPVAVSRIDVPSPAPKTADSSPGNLSVAPPETRPVSAAQMDPDSLPGAQRAAAAARILAASTDITVPSPDSALLSGEPAHMMPTYTGRLISLDLRGVDIRDFFRLIHQVSGLNIVVDSDVQGDVTLALSDVPWDQALDLVLKDNDLGKVLQGNVLRIAKVKTLASEADETVALRKAKLNSEPLVSIVRRLRYASAEDQMPNMSAASGTVAGLTSSGAGSMSGNMKPISGVATLLNQSKGSVLSPRGNAVADPRDNAVIVTDVPSQMPIIKAFIDKLDTKTKQVSIQVRVVLASSDFTRSLSSVLSGTLLNKSGSTQTGGATGTGVESGAPGVGIPASGSTGSSTTLSSPLTAAGFGAFAITNAGARYAINAAISAAEERDQARTISRPVIVTQNNFPGEVMQGVQIPIQTTINFTVSVQYVNAALQLVVTPQVTVDNRVFLTIFVNNASIGSLSVANVGPSINTQQATTQVLVPDGGTVVFGGISVITRTRSANYIPLLGSIPILGNLFKSSSVNDQNQQLLFFVSPTVLTE